jgi:hypothetical protein
MAIAAVIPIALATDTFSIAVMEVIDNAIMLTIPGAMGAGAGDVLFWGALSVALVLAGLVAFPVNRWLITRGKGHAVLHETGIHGGPPTRVVAGVAALAFVFGTTVLVVEAATGEGGHGSGGGHGAAAGTDHGGEQEAVRGLAVSSGGLTLELDATEVDRGRREQLSFRIVDEGGDAVRDFEVEHEKRMHLIVARRDMAGFQHLHPALAADGTWSTPITLRDAGSYRVFADFKRDGRNETLAADLAVDGPVDWKPLPAPSTVARSADGYDVALDGAAATAGSEAELSFTIERGGRPVEVEPYLGAGGHLVALREGDLAYLHVHPTEGDGVRFATEFPSSGRYRLFLQFKDEGRVHTAAFTQEVAR